MITTSANQTKNIAAAFGRTLSAGTVLALVGELGAGKTTFVQGLAEGLGCDDPSLVRSPSYTLLAEYPGKTPLYHLDLYRLARLQEVEGLGLEEYFSREGITVVEWADRFPGILPSNAVWIEMRIIDQTKREIVFRGKTS